jgi:hypothetical protein
MALHLLALPNELLRHVASFLSSYKDLKALCLTCSAIHGQALQELYATIIVSIEQVTLLDPSNPGLIYTRQFRLVDMDADFDEERHATPLRRLLYALPSDRVQFIHLGTYLRVTDEIYGIIHFRQRKLRNLVLYSKISPGLQPWSSGEGLDKIVVMEIQIADDSAFQLGRFLLERTPRLQELTLRSYRHFTDDENAIPSGRDDSLFGPLLSARGESMKLNLRKVTLYAFNLNEVKGFLEKRVNLTKLTHLAMIDCTDESGVLQSLAPQLWSLLSFTDEQIRDIRQPNTYDTFLTGLFGLRALRLSMEGFNEQGIQLRWNTIGLFWKMLRLLFVHDNMLLDPFDRNTPSFARFAEMCSSCSNLEQLAIQTPQEALQRGMSQSFLDGIKRLRKLRALRLFVHDDELDLGDRGSNPDRQDAPLVEYAEVREQSKTLVEAIFVELRDACPKLRAIGIDVSQIRDGVVQRENHGAFLRAFYTDPLNNTRPVPQLVHPAMIKHYEACSEIFDNMENREQLWHFAD